MRSQIVNFLFNTIITPAIIFAITVSNANVSPKVTPHINNATSIPKICKKIKKLKTPSKIDKILVMRVLTFSISL